MVDVAVQQLRELGVSVDEPEMRDSTRFGIPGTFVIVNESEWIEFAQFPTTHFAIAQAASFDLDGGRVSGPTGGGYGLGVGGGLGNYYYRYGNMLVYYFGNDERITDTFESYGAQLFAGSDNLLSKGAEAVKTDLESRGFQITDPDLFDMGMELFGGHRSKYFFADGEEIHIWEYERPSNLSGAPRGISQNGRSIKWRTDPVVRLDQEATPWFFEQGNSIALYIGDNQEIVDALRDIAGREFAGGRLDETYPWTADDLQELLERRGLIVKRQEPENPGSFLTTPSETWLLNDVPVEVFVFEGPSLTGYDPSLSGDRPHATPYLFEKANAAIHYIGDDPAILNALEEVFGWSRNAGELPIERMELAKGEVEAATVNSVEAYSRSPHMDGYVAKITSENGGCVRYHGHTVERDGERFIITVTNRDYATAWGPPPDDGTIRGCTLDLRFHTTYVALDEIDHGALYTVEVNDKEWASFVAD